MVYSDPKKKYEYDKLYYQKNRKKLDKAKRNSQLIRKYNINIKDYDNILESQKGVCAICGKIETIERFKYLAVDHCHKTDKVRGLLCNKCNRGLGLFGENIDNLEKAIKYLRRYKK